MSEITGGKFANGAVSATFIQLVKSAPEFYKDKVGYELNASPGGEAVGKHPIYGRSVEGTNNIGVQNRNVDLNSVWGEGGFVSRVANQIYGVNAVAGFHDVMQVSMGSAIWRDILNVPGMGVAAGVTYGGFLGKALNASPANLYIPVNVADKKDKRKNYYIWMPVGY